MNQKNVTSYEIQESLPSDEVRVITQDIADNKETYIRDEESYSSSSYSSYEDISLSSITDNASYLSDEISDFFGTSAIIEQNEPELKRNNNKISTHSIDIDDLIEQQNSKSSAHSIDVDDLIEQQNSKSSAHSIDVDDFIEQENNKSSTHSIDADNFTEQENNKSSTHSIDADNFIEQENNKKAIPEEWKKMVYVPNQEYQPRKQEYQLQKNDSPQLDLLVKPMNENKFQEILTDSFLKKDQKNENPEWTKNVFTPNHLENLEEVPSGIFTVESLGITVDSDSKKSVTNLELKRDNKKNKESKLFLSKLLGLARKIRPKERRRIKNLKNSSTRNKYNRKASF